MKLLSGRVAQLGERIVRNDEAGGSSPPTSTKSSPTFITPIYCLFMGRRVAAAACEVDPERIQATGGRACAAEERMYNVH
jgi:hypothetical protein